MSDMLNWFNSKTDWYNSQTPHEPVLSENNPGQGLELRIAFANDEDTWIEEVNLVNSLAEVLTSHDHIYNKHASFIQLDSGFILQPQIVELQPLDNGGVRTVSTIEVSHPQLIHQGIFEYQHASGKNTADSLLDGFQGWVEMDLVVFLDLLHQDVESCMSLEMDFPETETRKALCSRVLLGPPSYFVADQTEQESEEHSFCPCCLFTNTFEAFGEFLESDQIYGIRLFAGRDENGMLHADCRINGEDWESGKRALIRYAETWPNRGFEFRKQYICIQSWDNPE